MATAGSLALSSSEPPRPEPEFTGDRRPGILHEPLAEPLNPGENGIYYHDLTAAAASPVDPDDDATTPSDQ